MRIPALFLLLLVLCGCKQEKSGPAIAPPTVPVSLPDTVTISPYEPQNPPKLLESFCVFSVATLNGESLEVADTLCILCGGIDTLSCPGKLLVKLGKDTVYNLKRVSKSPSDIFCQACPAKKKKFKSDNAPQPL